MFLGGLLDSWRILIRKMCTGILLVTPIIPGTKIFAMLSERLNLLLFNIHSAKKNERRKGRRDLIEGFTVNHNQN